MTRKLYEIVENMQQLEVVLEQMDEGDATYDTVKEYLDGVELELSEKVENILKYKQNLDAEANMFKEEKKRLEKLQKSAERKSESLGSYLQTMLKALGYDYKNKKKIETSIGKVGFQKNPPTIEIIDEEKALKHFKEFVKQQPIEFRKKDVMKAVKEELPQLIKGVDETVLEELGVKYINNNSHLRIR